MPVEISTHQQLPLLILEDLHATFRKIQDVPVLVIAGEQDHVFDVGQSKSFAASIAGSEFVLLPETGHLAPRENPHAVNAAIDRFLTARLAR